MKLSTVVVPGLSSAKNLAATIALVLVVLSAPACGTSSSDSVPSRASGVLGLVPDWVAAVRLIDVGQILQGNAPEMADGMVREFEHGLDEAGISTEDVTVLVLIEEDASGYAMFLEGEFDFVDIRDALDDADYDDDDYRGYELWEGRGVGGGYDVALLEEDGYVILGMASGAVEDVLKSLGRDRLLLKADDHPLKRVLDRVGQGWLIEAGGPCSWDVRGCDAMAVATDTGDAYSVEVTVALLFGSERLAERAERRINDILEGAEDDIRSLDYDELKVEGEFIVARSSVDEDDLYSLLARFQLDPGLNLAATVEPTPGVTPAPRFTPGAASVEPVVVEKEVVKEVPKEIIVEKVVVREVPVEVIKEVPVTKEVLVTPTDTPVPTRRAVFTPTATALAPTPSPTSADNPVRLYPAGSKRGGFINMSQYADVRQRMIHQSSVLNMNMAPLFNNLIEYNPETADQGDLRCDLCESWELAEDGVTYTFKVHPDATWWDGRPVTARDVVFSLESMVAPYQFPAIKGRSTSTHCSTRLYYNSGRSRAIDEKTVEVITKFPSPGFFPAIANHTCLIIPEHVVVGQEIPQAGNDMDALVGSGPFKFADYVRQVSVEYTRNDDYFKEGRPYIDGMKHFVITNPRRVTAAFKTGQILTSNQSIDNLTVAEALQLDEEMDNLTMHWAGPISMMYIAMNTAKAPFDKPEVRKAVNLAINPQPIIDSISEGMYTKGYPLPRGFWYSLSDEEYDNLPGYRDINGEKHPDDLAEAKRLLASVGMDGPFSITLNARNCCDYPDVAVLVKQQLEEALGWDITIKVMESGAGFDAYWAGDYQSAVQGGSIFMNEPDAIFARYIRGTIPQWTGGGRGKYYAPEGLEALFEQQVQELDQGRRKAIVHEMAKLAYEGTANPYIFWTDRHWGVEHRIRNFNFTYQGMRWEHVWCDPECR